MNKQKAVTRRSEHGISILELTISFVLLGILFYCIYSLLRPGLRVWRESDMRVSTQQNTLVGIYRMINDAKETNSHSVIYGTYDPAVDGISSIICFASARDRAGTVRTGTITCGGTQIATGEPEWQQYIIYYLDSQNRLRRYETLASSPPETYQDLKGTNTMRIKEPAIYKIRTGDLLRDKVIARNIKKMEAVPRTLSTGGQTAIFIRLTAYDPHNNIQDYSLTLETAVGVRYNEKKN